MTDSMRHAAHAAGLLKDPVDGAEHVMAKKGGIRRPVEKAAELPEGHGRRSYFDRPMSPWSENTPTHKDPAYVLRRNKQAVLAGGMLAWVRAAKILGVEITPHMRQSPLSLRNEIRRVLEK